MATGNRPSLLPFIQEVFLNKQPVRDFIKRNKLLCFVLLLNILLILITLFSMEQTIKKTKQFSDLKQKTENYVLKPIDKNSECNLLLSALEDDYRLLNGLYTECKDNKPIPKPKRTKEPVIVHRPITADDSLKRKLDEIR